MFWRTHVEDRSGWHVENNCNRTAFFSFSFFSRSLNFSLSHLTRSCNNSFWSWYAQRERKRERIKGINSITVRNTRKGREKERERKRKREREREREREKKRRKKKWNYENCFEETHTLRGLRIMHWMKRIELAVTFTRGRRFPFLSTIYFVVVSLLLLLLLLLPLFFSLFYPTLSPLVTFLVREREREKETLSMNLDDPWWSLQIFCEQIFCERKFVLIFTDTFDESFIFIRFLLLVLLLL